MSLVPLALFLDLKMCVTRHIILVLLIPDKRGTRNVIAAIGLLLHALVWQWKAPDARAADVR